MSQLSPRTLSLLTLAALALAVTGCGGRSVVIRDSDATFERASQRLERTAAAVEATGAPAKEQLAFMQAEGLYRYRFDASQGTAKMTAEAAAALTDLPVLQSFSGSVDVADLRLRSADAAVQLWETFLVRYPRSPLRRLALYRLGFAYRTAGASGLPRDSGDAAFDELTKETPPDPLTTAAVAAREVQWKSKDKAALWSIVPGLGQMYVGETLSGSLRLAAALLAGAAIIVPTVIAAQRGTDLTFRHDWPLIVSGVAGLVVLSFDYTSSYEDAMRGVVQWNERAEAKFENEHAEAP
jgi:hypothetical protein